MSSRQEEKERRRQERVAAEEAAARSEARKRRVRLLVGAGLALAAAAAVVIAIVASGSGDNGPKTDTTANGKSVLPPRQVTDLPTAVKAAGCTTSDTTVGLQAKNRDHVASTSIKYATNPPSYGPHNSTPASDGDYVGQGTPKAVNYVHSLEHGRIEIQYKPGTPKAQIDQLEALFKEALPPYAPGEYVLLFENNTQMPSAVAAAAWDHTLTCPTFNSKVFDALRAFRTAYTLKAPEFINQPE